MGSRVGGFGGSNLFLGYGEPVCARELDDLAYFAKSADHDLGFDVVHVE